MNHDVTLALHAWRGGDEAALGRLLPGVYGDLRRIARRHLARERPGHTLQPTALAHEAYLKLARHPGVDWQGRAHFLAVASLAMRRELVSHARRRRAGKRGGPETAVPLAGEPAAAPAGVDVLDLERALGELADLDPRQAKVVHLRVFGGLTVEEAAAVLAVSPATVKLDWSLARAFLRRRLEG